MAVPAGPTEKRYTGNGVTKIFTIPFLLLAPSDLDVFIDGVEVVSGFTITGAGNPTSTITFTVAPPNLSSILLNLNVPFERLNDYQENGDFLSSTVNRDFDRIWQALKQLLRTSGRALTLGFFDVDGAGAYRAKQNRISDLADPVGLQDAVNKRWVSLLLETFTGAVNTTIGILYDAGTLFDYLRFGVQRTVDTYAAMQALSTLRNVRCKTLGYYQAGDGGHGDYFHNGAAWQLVHSGKVDARQFGARGDGTDCTAALQAAADAAKFVGLTEGNWLVSSTIQLQPGGQLVGAGMLRTRLQRQGTWIGPTIRIGLADGSVRASDCAVKGMLIEQLHPGFVLGVSTTMPDRLTNEQSQIECYGGYNSKFHDLWLQHGVYGLSLYGCVVPEISNIRSFGAWDNKTPAVCEQKAVIRLGSLPAVAGFSYCTEVRMDKLYIGTGAPSPVRTITVGTDITYSDYENVGSRCGLLVEAVEGLEIDNSYIGGCALDGIWFVPSTICSMINIDNTFFDESFTSNIRFFPTGTPVININIGSGCRFNGQSHTRNAIRAESNGGSPCVVGMSIDGIYGNLLETPFLLLDAKAVTFKSGIIVNNYNVKKSTTNSGVISAGGYFSPTAREIHVFGGLWGGGTNDWSTNNGCKWGPLFDTGSTGSASNVRAILSATITGGSAVGGISQTYPT